MIKAFDHVAITVEDFEGTINWYTANLGLEIYRMIENPERGRKIAFLGLKGHAMLEFFGFIEPRKSVEGPVLQEEETGIKHISFFVDDLENMCQRLKEVGIEFRTITERRALFKDPNGVNIEIRIS